jgi:nucleoside-diphosphate kinase
MIQLDNDIINEHYAHIADKPFFPAIVKYMQRTPVIAIAAKGKNAVLVVRSLI